jgi:hypothetical protein
MTWRVFPGRARLGPLLVCQRVVLCLRREREALVRANQGDAYPTLTHVVRRGNLQKRLNLGSDVMRLVVPWSHNHKAGREWYDNNILQYGNTTLQSEHNVFIKNNCHIVSRGSLHSQVQHGRRCLKLKQSRRRHRRRRHGKSTQQRSLVEEMKPEQVHTRHAEIIEPWYA